MLLPHRSVHPMQQVLPDGLQLSHHALGLRLPFDHEPAAPGPSAVVRETQEVEGLRSSLPGSCPSLGGEPPELDQPGLALVERQAELRQPVLELRKKLPRLCLVLTAERQSSSGGESHPSALSEPDVRLSPHPAPTLQPPAARPVAKERTGRDRGGRCAPASASPHAPGVGTACTSAAPISREPC